MIGIRFNDAKGNQFDGIKNDILRSLGDTLTATIRRCDMVGRIDTDTFAVLVSSGSGKDSGAVVQRLRNDLGKLQTRFEKTVVFSIDVKHTTLRLEAETDGERHHDDALEALEKKDSHGLKESAN
jgi:GGDEF domain-containing protein